MPDPWKFHGMLLYVIGFMAIGVVASYIIDWMLK